MPLRKLSALALVAALALSACSSDDPEPKVAPEPSRSASSTSAASPSASASAPASPDDAQDRSPNGARTFADHYIDVLNFAQRTGSTDKLRAMSDASCTACFGYIDAIDEVYAAGGTVSGGQISHDPFRDLPPDYGAEWGGYAAGRSTAQAIVDGQGERTTYPGGPVKLFVYTTWTADGWVMKWMRTPS
jgi:hypothetical protein